MPDPRILAPTWFEYCLLRGVPGVTHAGIGLRRWDGEGSDVVVTGLAGALVPMSPGTIVVPDEVATVGGKSLRCDSELRDRFVQAVEALGYPVRTGPLLTAGAMVTGPERVLWAGRGFVAADMETGLLAGRPIRVGAVRVVLDAPAREISADWVTWRAALRPARWGEAVMLGVRAPRYMRRLARVLESALGGAV
ncbi:MAG TPA: hypothetical protein VFB58_12180 [Chloroflexota bacterium]|nr:hypothetical protein [Chloroflexota bacterium]